MIIIICQETVIRAT
jgi:hypothetical protein